MEDLNDKVTGGTLTADEWNQVPSEIQNVIEESGIALSSGDVTQQLQAIYNIARRGLMFSDSGSVDDYVLTSVHSQASTEYREGMLVIFSTTNPNIGASTVNVDGLGDQNIYANYGTTDLLEAGDINGLVTLIYDGTNFSIYSNGSGSNSVYDNNSPVQFRNAADSADVGVVNLDASDNVILGVDTEVNNILGTVVSILVGASQETALQATQNDAIILYFNNIEGARTSDTTTSTVTTGLRVRDKDSTLRDVGYNTMPPITTGVSLDLDSSNCGKFIQVQGAGVTISVGTDVDIPDGATWMIGNRSAGSNTATLSGGASSLVWMDGSGSVSLPTGDRTLPVGGVATITKVSSGTYLVFGGGIS
ncbi:MAG: hypothetical protein K0U20_09910 [Proteobacteria bacterium]|nr:hypothetical protein [Pseudomonadota bacterium]MCH9735880.1 hypothetical protein [Actinomycetes bacterium]